MRHRLICPHPQTQLFLCFSPCSVHDVGAALDYAKKLRAYAEQAKDDLHIIMRVYFEKCEARPCLSYITDPIILINDIGRAQQWAGRVSSTVRGTFFRGHILTSEPRTCPPMTRPRHERQVWSQSDLLRCPEAPSLIGGVVVS